ncbi:Spy/CpxP family protein refolding chaperone [Flectobacillus major]|jgi:Spy/CpxP family protein refolding chaperone|uniref:Spy/CpxP family protein refolding chaperone n=1 Tax=Flectobacillus major TaxID=103 RepID=UPI00040A618C|nr:hypothetical protein [Flectobacillus major]
MKRLIVLFTCLAFVAHFTTMAQEEPQHKGREKLKAARLGLITNRLNLTEEQAKGFWPVFNDYDAKRSELRKSVRQITAESRNLTTSDDRIATNLKEILNLKQKEVDLEKEYQAKFLKVLNVRQVSELYKTEQLFNQMLVNRLRGERKEPPHTKE